MKSSVLFFLLLSSTYGASQLIENFSDGDFSNHPTWTGTASAFRINEWHQLQSQTSAASTSWLFTPSQAVENATWECHFIIDFTTSSSNFACMYLMSDRPNLNEDIRGYYVMVGGTADEVSLFFQNGNTRTKIIDGTDKRTDGRPVNVVVKVTRDSVGEFRLYSRLPNETHFYHEGSCQHVAVTQSAFFGVSFTNSATTGNSYRFDNISVTGKPVTDVFPPTLNSFEVFPPDTILLQFSEAVCLTDLTIQLNEQTIPVTEWKKTETEHCWLVVLQTELKKGNIYSFTIHGIRDLAGNRLSNPSFQYAATDSLLVGDVVLNEVMFHQPDSSFEYLEIYNRTDKLIDVSGIVFTTRRADNTFNTGNKIPAGTLLAPHSYLCISAQPIAVAAHHQTPPNARIMEAGWNALNNETATLVLLTPNRQTVLDEFTYHANMHHVLIKNTKGVALERMMTNLPTNDPSNWRSASSGSKFGTPGYKNSQHRETHQLSPDPAPFQLLKPYFTPDNDGEDDVCIIQYQLSESGYMAQWQIVNSNGIFVYGSSENTVLATEGVLLWDGSTHHGKSAQPGLYVAIIEVFHPTLGKRKKYSLPLIVASR